MSLDQQAYCQVQTRIHFDALHSLQPPVTFNVDIICVGTQYYSLPNERDRHLKTNEIPAAWKTFEYPAVCPAGTATVAVEASARDRN